MAKRSTSLRRSRIMGRALVFNLSYGLLILASLAMIVADMQGGDAAKRIRSSATDFMAPMIHLISKPVEFVSTIVTGISDLANLRHENITLKEENERLSAWRTMAIRMNAENHSLRQLLQYHSVSVEPFITARVVSNVGGAFVRTALLDSGTAQGITLNDIAMTSKGLVGRVTDVGQQSARLLLLTDMNSRVPVFIGTNGYTSVLAGDNTHFPELIYVSNREEIKKGDRVFTSGHGGVFPPNLPIGTVHEVTKDAVRVNLNVDFTRLSHVALIKSRLEHMVSDVQSVAKEMKEQEEAVDPQ